MATKPDGDDPLVERVRAALAGVAKVTEKRMFGSTGFMVRGKLCLAARASGIMCRIDPATHAAAIELEGCHPVVMKGRTYRGYVDVDASALDTEKALLFWVNQALEFNRTLPEAVK